MLTIEDGGAVLIITTEKRTIEFPKKEIRFEMKGDNLKFTDNQESVEYAFNLFTSPVFSSIADAKTQIDAMLDTSNVLPIETDLGILSAPGVSASISAAIHTQGTYQVTVANIDTSVTVRAEGSLDGVVWYNLDFKNVDTVRTANGTFAMTFSKRTNKFVRFNFVSEAGGTAATLAVKFAETHS